MMYYQYFRLKAPPFQAASPDGAVYFSPTHLEGLATLESGLSGDLSGLTLLTGEAGTGKTTLIYSLLQRDYKRVRIAHIDDPKLSFLEIMRVILTQLNLYSTGSTKLDYLEALDRFLKLRGKEERIAIIVDESQVLSDDVLEELRLLSGHGQLHDRGLHLILVGQPELVERLKKPELRQLNQRISSRGVLKPLTEAQAIKYVECRLSAQGSKCSAIFEPGALKRLLRRSDGIPRKVNMLCHSAMLAAYSAGEKKVSVRTAKKTAAEYHDSVGIANRGTRARLMRAMPALIAGTALAWLLLLGFIYPNVWSDWVPKHTGGAVEPTPRPVKPVKQVKPVERGKTVEQAGVEGLPGSGAQPKAAAPLATHPVELRASLAPGAAAPPAPKSDVAVPAPAREMPIVPTAPAAAAVSAATHKQIAVPAAPERRGQITVKYGDTLEEIAIRYFGSKSGINQLIEANPQLTDINQLSVGQIIYLPPGITPKASHDQTAIARPVPNAEDSTER
jgi:general secretion pathway protein A